MGRFVDISYEQANRTWNGREKQKLKFHFFFLHSSNVLYIEYAEQSKRKHPKNVKQSKHLMPVMLYPWSLPNPLMLFLIIFDISSIFKYYYKMLEFHHIFKKFAILIFMSSAVFSFFKNPVFVFGQTIQCYLLE